MILWKILLIVPILITSITLIIFLIFIIKERTSPHMYLWRKQWNWMSSIILFKLKNNVLHI
ncbi:hypothetical protein [Spiroplasma ixodetis]|uniref:hypothetical protein n=1 Tax=Spiroplasma ixodetis TaxID=2141 RepID=UPI0024919F2F|nr:hypothetical protein [Spiroplasma ixodetis]